MYSVLFEVFLNDFALLTLDSIIVIKCDIRVDLVFESLRRKLISSLRVEICSCKFKLLNSLSSFAKS